MRAKKNREVNIFSASVVDLFASGLGVFLIVSIIALVNQKKETAKNQYDKSEKNFEIIGDADKAEMEKKVQKLEKEIFNLKVKNLENTEITGHTQKETQMKIDFEVEKSRFINQNEILEKQISALKKELNKQDSLIAEMSDHLESKNNKVKNEEKASLQNFSKYDVGSKIRLENVQFYPGTDRPIEPYASREIKEFALFMKANPKVMVEVSGHIFETKKAIEDGKADDEYNLSGARARAVCRIIEEFGVGAKRLRCIGYGAQRSVFLTNDQYSEEAQKNRRVEIEILSK